MTADYYLTGRDEKTKIDYYVFLASNIDEDKLFRCVRAVERLRDWFDSEPAVPDTISMHKVNLDLFEGIILFLKAVRECEDYKHFAVSVINDWYRNNIIINLGLNENDTEYTKVIVDLDMHTVDIVPPKKQAQT